MIPFLRYSLLPAILLFSSSLFSQQLQDSTVVNLSLTPGTLARALEEITRQTAVHFSYSSRSIDDSCSVSLNFKNEKLAAALDELCRQCSLSWQIVHGQVVLRKEKQEKLNPPTITVSGYVRDKTNGETLPGATLWIASLSTGTTTNSYGFFSITMPQSDVEARITYIGYEPETIVFGRDEKEPVQILLEPSAKELPEVTIVSDREREKLTGAQMSRSKLNPAEITRMPEFAGEVGLIRSLQSLPGIKTHSDGSAFFFVRGGNKDQNLILVDEAPIYNPAHMFGYYSVIIPETASEINIYRGDLPVDKGDRLSSVIDVHTRNGNLKRYGASGLISPFIYRIAAEGPVKKEKASFYTSFRHSSFGWLQRLSQSDGTISLYDFTTKLNWIINNDNRIYGSFYYGEDNLINNETGQLSGLRWHNTAGTFRWNHVFSSKLFSNATLSASGYEYNLIAGKTTWVSAINNLKIAYDLTHYGKEIKAHWGAELSWHGFDPGNLVTDNSNPFVPVVDAPDGRKVNLYFSFQSKPERRFVWKAGARLNIWKAVGPSIVYRFDENRQVTDTLYFRQGEEVRQYVNFDPRISLRYRLSTSLSVKAGAGIYHQYLNLISNSTSPFSSFEVWLPAGDFIMPQAARQLSAGIVWIPEDKGWEITAESYYKKMSHQIEYQPHSNLLLNPLMESELEFGEAEAYGTEIMIRRKTGRLTGWVSYTWSRVFKRFSNLNNGDPWPAWYDRPNDLAIYLNWKISGRLIASVNWIWYTGSAITTPVGFYESNGSLIPLYDKINNSRLPDYHRLDTGLEYMLNKPGKRYAHYLSFAIYNLYNRHNPVSVNFDKVKTEDGSLVVPTNLYNYHDDLLVTQTWLMGILPTISYKFNW